MNLESTTKKVEAKATSVDAIDATVKFVMEEGVIFVDGSGDANQVHNENKEADLDVDLNLEVFNQMMDGEMNPMMAVMNNDITLDGDMAVAMKLTALFADE